MKKLTDEEIYTYATAAAKEWFALGREDFDKMHPAQKAATINGIIPLVRPFVQAVYAAGWNDAEEYLSQ